MKAYWLAVASALLVNWNVTLRPDSHGSLGFSGSGLLLLAAGIICLTLALGLRRALGRIQLWLFVPLLPLLLQFRVVNTPGLELSYGGGLFVIIPAALAVILLELRRPDLLAGRAAGRPFCLR